MLESAWSNIVVQRNSARGAETARDMDKTKDAAACATYLVVVGGPHLEGGGLLDGAVAHEDGLLGGGGLECHGLAGCHGGLDERGGDGSHCNWSVSRLERARSRS
jgi:hypothetical protein